MTPTPPLRPLAPPSLLATFDRARGAAGAADGRCVAEGWRLAERAVGSGVAIEAALVGQGAVAAPTRDVARALAAFDRAGVAVFAAEDAWIAARTEGRTFGPLLTLARRPAADLDACLAAAGPLVILERVLDPGNIGAIARSALALGAAGLLVVEGCDPYHGKALRTSMGALWRLPAVRWPDSGALLVAACSAQGRYCLAAALDGPPLAEALAGAPPARRYALLLGSEAHGLRPATVAACDGRARIAMAGDDAGRSVDSLSVAAAAAVLLYALGATAPEG